MYQYSILMLIHSAWNRESNYIKYWLEAVRVIWQMIIKKQLFGTRCFCIVLKGIFNYVSFDENLEFATWLSTKWALLLHQWSSYAWSDAIRGKNMPSEKLISPHQPNKSSSFRKPLATRLCNNHFLVWNLREKDFSSCHNYDTLLYESQQLAFWGNHLCLFCESL